MADIGSTNILVRGLLKLQRMTVDIGGRAMNAPLSGFGLLWLMPDARLEPFRGARQPR